MPDDAAAADRNSKLGVIADVLAAIFLSIAGLASSWSSYQAALWDGEQSRLYTLANSGMTEASLLTIRDGQLTGIDIAMFANWLASTAEEKPKLQAFYELRFRPGFKRAFTAWRVSDPVSNSHATPFDRPEYVHVDARRARALHKVAQRYFSDGEVANHNGDSYVAISVVLASVLFFGGMAQLFKRTPVRLILMLAAALCCIIGLIRLYDLPLAI